MKRLMLGVSALAMAAWATMAAAQQLTDNVVKLGVLTDMSSLYADINGPGAVIAVQMAVEDFGGTINGKKIEIIQADVQNKADVAATIAGRWFDTENVDAILGTGASSSSIATSRVANDKKKIYLATDPASSEYSPRDAPRRSRPTLLPTARRHRVGAGLPLPRRLVGARRPAWSKFSSS